jgi:leucine dehydrogenase
MVLKLENITDVLSGKASDPRFKANREYADHEQVIYAEDPAIGFRCFIAVHNTARGPALGGCRYSSYADADEAITDVLRLSKGMTYKNSLAQLDLGGGKCVIMGVPGQARPTREMMLALGEAVGSLKGAYVTAEDMNTSEENMEAVLEKTPFVSGVPLAKVAAGKFPAGFDVSTLPDANPSPYTSFGTYWGIRAAVKHKMGRDDLKDIRVAVKGAAGAVASELCRLLHEAGAKLIVSDMDLDDTTPAHLADIAKRAQEKLDALAAKFGARKVSSAEIMTVDADVYAPCARGGDVNDDTIATLGAGIIAGCANNVLAEPRHARMLHERGVLYAPDYAINAGGVICAGMQYLWHAYPERYEVPTHEGVLVLARNIHDVLLAIFERAKAENADTASIADRISEERFREKKMLSAAA